jgi:hypothetical protein
MRHFDVWAVMGAIFFDHFVLATTIFTAAFAVLAVRRLFRANLDYRLTVACWLFLVIGAAAAALVLVCTYFKHEEGLTRLALVAYVLCTSLLLLNWVVRGISLSAQVAARYVRAAPAALPPARCRCPAAGPGARAWR